MTTDWTQTTRALKAVVIGLGVLIVLAAAAVVAELVRRGGSLADQTGAYATAPLSLPPGARVLGMSGEDDVLSLLVEEAGGGQRIITIDRRSGAVLGTLTLTPGD
jgi:hypothetical protein